MGPLFGLLVIVGMAVLMGLWFAKIQSFLWDARFCPRGIDIVVLGGRFRVFQIKRCYIREVCVAAPFSLEMFMGIFNTCNLSNRIARRYLFVKTTGFLQWMFTPEDPEAAARALGFTLHRRR